MFEDTAILSNPKSEPVQLYIEPWGYAHTFLPGQSIRVVATSAKEGKFEIVEEQNKITIYGWEGSIMKFFCNDELIFDFEIPVPEMPKGMSSRSFIKIVFGGPGEPKDG